MAVRITKYGGQTFSPLPTIGGVTPGTVGQPFSGGGGGRASNEADRIAAAEATRQAAAEAARQAVAAEAARKAAAARLASVARQQQIQQQLAAFKLQSEDITKQSLTRGANESTAAYNYRAAQLSRAQNITFEAIAKGKDKRLKEKVFGEKETVTTTDLPPEKVSSQIESSPRGGVLGFLSGEFTKLSTRVKQVEQIESAAREQQSSKTFGTLFKEGDLPSAVFKTSDIVGTKLIGVSDKIVSTLGGPELSTSQKGRAGRFVGDNLLFTGFSPAMATTAATELTTLKKTDVLFSGFSQKTSGGLTESKLAFLTSSGKKGVARGVTRQVPTGTGLTKSVTLGEGAIISRRVAFPTLKTSFAKIGEFKGIQQAVTGQTGKKFIQVSKGAIFQGKDNVKTIFGGVGGGEVVKDTTKFFGGVQTPKDFARIFGKVTKVGSPESSGVISTGAKITRPTTALESPAMQSLQSIVSAGVQTTPKVSTFPSVVSTTVLTGINIIVSAPQKQVGKIDTTQIQTGSLDQLSSQKLSTGLKNLLGSPQKTKQKTQQKTKQVATQLPKLDTITKQSQKVSSLFKQQQAQAQKQKLFTPFAPVIPIIPKTPKKLIIPFALKGTTLFGKQPKRVQVFGRRFGKWKSIGFARTPRKALTFGRNWAEKTLGVSFKVGGKIKPRKIKHFRTKTTKQGTIFIEKRGRRLKKRGSEVREIQLYPKRKKKKEKGGKRK